MGKFKISKSFTMPRDEIRRQAEELAGRLERKHGVRALWQGDAVNIKGKGVQGTLNFEGDTIDVSVKLGLLASAFEGVMKKELQKYLDEHIT